MAVNHEMMTQKMSLPIVGLLQSLGFSIQMSLGLPDFGSLTNSSRRGGASAGEVLVILGAVLLAGFGSVLVLVFMSQLSSTSLFSGLPGGSSGSNATSVNKNIANGIVTASSFETIILIAGFGALALSIFLLIFVALRHFRTS